MSPDNEKKGSPFLSNPDIRDIQTRAEFSNYLINITIALENANAETRQRLIDTLKTAKIAYDLGCGYVKAGTNMLTAENDESKTNSEIPNTLCPNLESIRYVDAIAKPIVESPHTFHQQFICDFLNEHQENESDVIVIAHAPNHYLNKPENNGAQLLFNAMSENGILIGFLQTDLRNIPDIDIYFEKVQYTQTTRSMSFSNTEIYIRRANPLV